MKYLYLWLNIGSFIIPFLFSFHPRLQFYKKWRSLFPAILIMMIFFIPWDIIFTNKGIWGFNEAYISGIHVLNLPLEEWLFFICIPYACLFTHYALLELFPKISISTTGVNIIYVVLCSILVITLWFFYDRWYTLVNFIYALILLGILYNYRRNWLKEFFPTYLVILVPFFLVNGILTGTGIDDQVVWYNDAENLGVRLLTIPVEDIIYNLGMLATVFGFTEFFEHRYHSKVIS
ncbi:MAG: lycopene cyclase domain-containing protein [Flavobacteriaceae bacterium]|nr:lycopene cyclase domain-containing protein [Flavobacteriaceae bacterium]